MLPSPVHKLLRFHRLMALTLLPINIPPPCPWPPLHHSYSRTYHIWQKELSSQSGPSDVKKALPSGCVLSNKKTVNHSISQELISRGWDLLLPPGTGGRTAWLRSPCHLVCAMPQADLRDKGSTISTPTIQTSIYLSSLLPLLTRSFKLTTQSTRITQGLSKGEPLPPQNVV